MDRGKYRNLSSDRNVMEIRNIGKKVRYISV